MKINLETVLGGLILFVATSVYSAEVVFNTSIEGKKRDDLSIYKMEKSSLNKDEVIGKFSRVFEVAKMEKLKSGAEFKDTESRYSVMGDDFQISFSKNGNDFYMSNFNGLKLTGKTGKLPSDEEAIDLSYRFLEKTGLMPKNKDELKIDHVGGIMQMLTQPDKKRDLREKITKTSLKNELTPQAEKPKLEVVEKNPKTLTLDPHLNHIGKPEKKAVVVYFYREIEGLRVMNYGSSITMTLAEGDIPAGLQYHWRKIAGGEKMSHNTFIPPEKIYAMIEEDINKVFSKDAKVIVEKIELVLYDNGGDYIQPAYCYRGYREDKEKDLAPMPVLGYVPVLSEVVEPIQHPALMGVAELPKLSDEKDVILSNEQDD